MKCERPDCDHENCDNNKELTSEFLLLVPACSLLIAGIFNTSFCCLMTGIAILGITYEINKMKKSIKNCGPWY